MLNAIEGSRSFPPKSPTQRIKVINLNILVGSEVYFDSVK